MARQAHFTVFLTPDGYHESGWKLGDHDAAQSITVEGFARTTALAERGLLDAVFIADRPVLPVFRAEFFPQVWFDPIVLLTALGMTSRRIGLIGTATTTYNAPYDLARRLSTADHATGGRIGWNVVTTHDRDAARNFGLDEHPEHDDRYARASEFVDVARRLWDSWRDDAVVADRAAGVWADIERIRAADFHGDYYDVAGALPVPRSPQGHPVLAQAGSSPAGVALAGRIADLVFTPQQSADQALAFRARIEAVAAEHGRRPGDIKILPGVAFELGRTEAEAAERRAQLEELADPGLRWRNLAYNAGLDPERIDPAKPLDPELAATAEQTTFGQFIVGRARDTQLPFGELAQTVTGLPGGLEFTGTPLELADLICDWVESGACDGFTLQPATVPNALHLFVEDVVPILQRRGLHRRAYTGATLRDHLGLPRPKV
jgi:FMN-dependent oxidoreductase (nitrilotriacetate monooxygenase family)